MTSPVKIGVNNLLVTPSVAIPDDAGITATTAVDSVSFQCMCALFQVFILSVFFFFCLFVRLFALRCGSSSVQIVRFMFVPVGASKLVYIAIWFTSN